MTSVKQRLQELIKRRKKSVTSEIIPFKKNDVNVALSFSQQRLWFLNRLMGPNAVYNMPLALRFRGAVNEDALVRSLLEIVNRHQTLRTRFEAFEDSAVQIIDPVIPRLVVEAIECQAELEKICQSETNYQFDLSKDRLCRIRLLRDESDLSDGDNGCYVLLVTMHHSISDGLSMGIFFHELISLYQALKKGEASPLPPLPIQYTDYAHWQRQWLQGEVLEEQLSYWRKQLQDLPSLLTLPTDRPRPHQQTFCGSSESISLPKSLSNQLQALSKTQGVTLYMSLLSTFSILMSRYSGQDDIAIGTPIANRTREETE